MPLEPVLALCHEAELFSPFFQQVQRPQVCSHSGVTGGEAASAAPGVSGCDTEALHRSTPGPAQQVSTWPGCWILRQEPLCMKTQSQPGAAPLPTSFCLLPSRVPSFGSPHTHCAAVPPSLSLLLNSRNTTGVRGPLPAPPLIPSGLAGHRTVHLNTWRQWPNQ